MLVQFNTLFRWREQFGYELAVGRGNLDSIRDGFEFNFAPPRGMVMELLGVDVLFREDPSWASGLLAIASEHSIYHLAHGRRFFCLLVLEDDSHLPGLVIESISVPGPYWNPSGRLPE